jgi:hypothetical protein
MDFIKAHLVSKIKRLYKEYEAALQPSGDNKFLYFDEPIQVNNDPFFRKKVNKINRVNAWYPFMDEEIVNSGWHELDGSSIREMYDKIKSNKVYIMKTVDNRFYKIRKKC